MALLASAESLRFLSEAGRTLAESLDPEATLAAVSRLVIPRLADWSAIHLVDEAGGMRRVSLIHPDPEKTRLARILEERYPVPKDSPISLQTVIRTGEPVLLREIPPEVMERAAVDAEHLALMRTLAMRSSIIVPLRARGRSLGTLSLVLSESGRAYDEDDLLLAGELAQRVSLAVDNARLHADSLRHAGTLSLMMDNIQEFVILMTVDGDAYRFQSVNRRFLQRTGLPPERIHGRRLEEVFPEPNLTLYRSWLAKAVATRQPVEFEHPFSLLEGEALTRITPVLDADGRLTHLLLLTRDVTPFRQAEEALRAEEERLRLALDAGRIGTWEWDVRSNRVTWSERIYAIHGMQPGSFGGRVEDFAALVHPEDRERVQAAIGKAIADRTTYEVEFRAVKPSGETQWIYTSARFQLDAAGEPARMIGVTVDITDRRGTEEALRKREEQYRFLTENVPQLIWMNDAEGNALFYNRQWEEYTGRRIDPGNPLAHQDLIHPEDMPRILETRRRAIAAGEAYGLDYRVLRKDGAYRWHISRVVPQRDPSGRIEAWFGTATDIHDLRAAQEGLRQSEAEFRAMFELAGSGKFQAEPATGRFLRVNQKFCRITGYAPAELETMSFLALVHPEDRWREEETRADLARGARRDWYSEVRLTRKDGSLRWVQVTGTLLEGEGEGSPGRALATVHDVTERKLAEEETLATQEKLRQSQKVEAVGRLAGGIAHDFNNLLTAINGYSDLLLATMAESHEHHAFVWEIKQAGERAASLTRQLLAYSRRQILNPKVTDLDEIVKGMANMLRRLIGETIELATESAPGLGKVRVDRGQIEQVILNLAINARDAMPEGGTLAIRTRNRALAGPTAAFDAEIPPGRYVELEIADTGHGMDADVLSRLFEPFFTTKDVGKGTGLGLSMVQGIVRQSEGWIQVESAPGRGATFRILLPEVAEAAPGKPPAGREGFLQEGLKGGESVLLVEDEAPVRRYVREILERAGYRVTEAANGSEALERARALAGEIQLLVTDVVMPGMMGPHLAEALRKERPDLKVVFMSGYSDISILRHQALDEKTNFLQKPFPPLELLRKIREVLGAPAR